MILQRGKLGFWEESYINNIFSNSEGEDFFGKKKFLLGEKLSETKKNPLKKNYCTYTQHKKREFSFFLFPSVQTKNKSKNSFFHLYSSFKTSFKSNKRLQSQFSSQEYNQNGEHHLKGKSILHQHLFSTPFFIIFNYFV